MKNAVLTLQMEWKKQLEEQKKRLNQDNWEDPSYLEDVPSDLRGIYDEVVPLYAYAFHAAWSKQLLVEYKGKRGWLHVNLDDGLVYYLDDKEGYLDSIPLGSHDYNDFYEVEQKPVYEWFDLDLPFKEWDNFGFMFANFDFRGVAGQLEQEFLNNKVREFMDSIDTSKTRIVNKGNVLYIVLPNGDEIRYKHASQL